MTSFRSRRGALTDAQQKSWDRQWPTIGADVSDDSASTPPPGSAAKPRLIIEIGIGTGTATAAMAKAEPHVNLIAIEVYRPGLAQLLQQIEREQIPNIRVLRGDAIDVLENMIAPESLTGVRVFFPDPWPKARHHKRRLLQAADVRADRRAAEAGRSAARRHRSRRVRRVDRRGGNAEPLLTTLLGDSTGPANRR